MENERTSASELTFKDRAWLAILDSLSKSLDNIIERPDSEATARGFIEGSVIFVVTKDEVQVRYADPTQAEPVAAEDEPAETHYGLYL